MSGPLFFAWVNAVDTTFDPAFAREDEDVFDLKIDHNESEFPVATILIRNPGTGLLAAGRKQWAWVSYAGTDTAGIVPIFFGRVAGQPVSMGEDVIQIVLRARPRDLQAQKEALAATLRVEPYWDPLWIKPDMRNDPETVLESRTQLWHFSRTAPVVTVSDIITGEDGTETFTEGDYFAGSISVSPGQQPLRNVNVKADVSWPQYATGEVDLSQTIIDLFHANGSSRAGLISSFTGQGLMESWPQKDDSIGGGWFVKNATVTREDGITVPLEYSKTKCQYLELPGEDEKDPQRDFVIRLALWQIRPVLIAGYEVERQRRETLTFTLSADVQPIWTDAEDEESETLTFSSNDVATMIDDYEGTDAAMPIGDVRRRQYFPTDRGQRSIKYLVTVARAHLLARSRAVDVSIDIPFDRAIELSCRKDAMIFSSELPGGSAFGKITSYSFGIKEGGDYFASMTISCCIGRGNNVLAVEGTNVYDEDYAASDYGTVADAVEDVLAEEVTYVPPTDPPLDDGIDFFNMTAENNVTLAAMMQGGENRQREILAQSYLLASDVVETLNNEYTRFRLLLRPLDGVSFDQSYQLTVSQLMIPKTFDLEV